MHWGFQIDILKCCKGNKKMEKKNGWWYDTYWFIYNKMFITFSIDNDFWSRRFFNEKFSCIELVVCLICWWPIILNKKEWKFNQNMWPELDMSSIRPLCMIFFVLVKIYFGFLFNFLCWPQFIYKFVQKPVSETAMTMSWNYF